MKKSLICLIAPVLSAGVQLLCHGPEYWELKSWLKEIQFGVELNSVDGPAPEALRSFVREPNVRDGYRERAGEAFCQRSFHG